MTKMGLEEYKGVYVFAQQVDNELSGIAFELLGKAKELAADLSTDVTAVLIGSGVKGLADQLAEYGADKVIVVDDPELKEYRTEPYAHALASVINEYWLVQQQLVVILVLVFLHVLQQVLLLTVLYLRLVIFQSIRFQIRSRSITSFL